MQQLLAIMEQSLLAYFIIINLVGFLMMGLDKYQAVHQNWRVAEKHFVLISLLGGFFGVYVGIRTFRHKTKKTSFQIKILGAFIVFVVLVYLGLFT